MFTPSNEPTIQVFGASGQQLMSVPWNHKVHGRVIGLKWWNEELCVMLSNGRVRWYYTFDGDFDEFELGFESALTGVSQWEVSTRGVIVLLSDGKVVRVTRSGRSSLIVDCSSFGDWKSWCVVNETIYACFDSIVYKIDSSVSKVSMDGPFTSMAVSSNKKLVSLYNTNEVSIITSDFSKVIMQWPCAPPVQISWCGNDAVAMLYEESIKLVAPGGELEFCLDDRCIIATEMEGVSILSPTKLEFLGKVDDSTVDCFKIGSRAKSAILIDAVDKLARHSPRSNENLEIIGDGLYDAIIHCLTAACEEFDPYWQKKLLKAASFGKAELEMRSQEHRIKNFVTVVDELRILNVIREGDIGLFLTYKEFKTLGISKIIEMLVKRQKFTESYQISQFCKLPLDLVFVQWSCSKIKYSQLADEELSQSIIAKFQDINDNRYISFEKISKVAFQEGRLNLAKVLINFESQYDRQIPLLLQMEEHELALQKALDSQDVDLTLETLMMLKSTLSYPQFFKLLNNSKQASNCFEYAYQDDETVMFDFYNQSDRLGDLAIYNMCRQRWSQNSVVSAMETFHKRDSSMDKLLKRQSSLIKIQETLSAEFNIDFKDLSLSQTILQLLKLSQHSKVSQVVKQFKFSDKKLAHLKLDFYCDTQRWDELYTWAIGKPGLPFEVIINRCIKLNEKRLATRLITSLNVSYEPKVELLIKLKDWKRVIDEAVKRRDVMVLDRVGDLVNDAQLVEAIHDAKQRIGTSSRFF